MTFNIIKYITLSCTFLVVILMSSCEADSNQNLPERNWQLTWSDEFEGQNGTLPDPTKWNYDIGNGTDGWGNQEFQYYTDRPENISLDGKGNLVITAKREQFAGSPFTSGRINTQGKFSQKYGRFEARLKTPFGPGIWPAFWMLGSNYTFDSWPLSGEIDILELRGQFPNIANGSAHGPGHSAGQALTNSFTLPDSRFDQDFHIFAIEWGEDFIEYYVDETLYFKVTPDDVPEEWVFNNSFFMILNVAVGGNFVGFPTSATPFPQKMTIDYIRVYK